MDTNVQMDAPKTHAKQVVSEDWEEARKYFGENMV